VERERYQMDDLCRSAARWRNPDGRRGPRFAVALSVVTGVLFGLVPSLAASRPDLAAALRGSGEATSAAGQHHGCILGREGCCGRAGSTVDRLADWCGPADREPGRVYRIDPGFQTSHLLTMKIALPPAHYDTDEKKTAFYEELVDTQSRCLVSTAPR